MFSTNNGENEKNEKLVLRGETKQNKRSSSASGCRWRLLLLLPAGRLAGWPAACYCCHLLSAAAGGCWCCVMPRGCLMFYRWTGSSAVCPPNNGENEKKIVLRDETKKQAIELTKWLPLAAAASRKVNQTGPRVPKWSPRTLQWSPKVTPNPQKTFQLYSKGDEMDPRVPHRSPKDDQTEPQGHPKC